MQRRTRRDPLAPTRREVDTLAAGFPEVIQPQGLRRAVAASFLLAVRAGLADHGEFTPEIRERVLRYCRRDHARYVTHVADTMALTAALDRFERMRRPSAAQAN